MKDGLYTDISIEAYHANTTHVSATTLKYAKSSLKHYEWYRNGKIVREDKPQFGFGNGFELALLDQQGFVDKVGVMQDKKWCAEAMKIKEYSNVRNSAHYQGEKEKFLSEHQGKYIITDFGKESFEYIQEMVSSCYRDAIIRRLIEGTEYQLSCFWTDPQTGIKLKTRPDICKRKKNVIVNVKTIEDGSPEAFSKDLAKWDYPLQAVIEIRGCIAAGAMETVDNYFWLVVEKVPPFNATIYEFVERDIAAVSDNLDYILHKIKKAEEQNIWPGYSDKADNEYGILKANIPLWYNF